MPMSDARPMADADAAMPLPIASEPAPPAEIVKMGAGGILLRGFVLAPDGPIEGEVLLDGDSIVCVAEDCSTAAGAADATVIDTHATIAPGLIDAHNHFSYDFLPRWEPTRAALFDNRYTWRDDDGYNAHVQPEGKLEAFGSGDPRNRLHMCAALRWAELRSIVHGTTTAMGQSPNRTCIQGLVRNADHSLELGTPNRMRTTIAGACESALDDDARANLVEAFESGDATRHAIHMAEGYTGGGVATDPRRELDCYAGRFRATTSLLTDSRSMPYGAALFIHAIAFEEDDLMETLAARAHVVWSPSSNLALYGRTAPIERMLELGIPVALGPDWTVSGPGEMLSELRVALEFADPEHAPAITTESLIKMATEGGAAATDTAMQLGRLAPGMRADVVVFGRIARDPYRAVIDSRASDVRLVLIDGAAYYGDLALEDASAVNEKCDTFDACGTPKFLCAAGTTEVATEGAETVDEIETVLRRYLDSGWVDSDGVQHGFVVRGDELAPLVDCGS